MPTAQEWRQALDDAPSQRGWSKRRAAAIAAAAERADDVTMAKVNAAARRLVWDRDILAAAVTTIEDRLRDLKTKLAADRERLDRVSENAQTTGNITTEAMRLKDQIRLLPEVIAVAEANLARAQDALASHRASMEAPVDVERHNEPDDDTPEDEPVAEAARGRGRPRKVQP